MLFPVVCSVRGSPQVFFSRHRPLPLWHNCRRVAREQKIDEIDAEFDAIRGLVMQAGSKAEAKKKEAAGTQSSLAMARGGADAHADFERLAAELSRETKAQPTDRLQSEEELAAAEAKRLKMLEAERLRRMQPDGGRGGGGGGDDAAAEEEGRKAQRVPTDDDLVDDFGLPGTGEPDYDSDEEEEEEEEGSDDADDMEEDDDDDDDEEEGGKAKVSSDNGLEEGKPKARKKSSEEDEEEDEEDDEDEEEEGSEEDGEGSEEEEGSEEDEGEGEEVEIRRRKTSTPAARSAPLEELPYVFSCPTTSKSSTS